MLVYKVTNTVTNKIYIGSSTKKLNERMAAHHSSSKNGSGLYFHKSIRKYGTSSFQWEILCECDTQKEMLEMEYHYIKQFNSMVPNGYNLTEGYDKTTLGFRFTKEQRKAQSERLKGNKNPNFGNTWSDEQKQAISKLNKGRLIGDKNPSKRADVRKVLSDGKMGDKNPRSKKWVLTSPEGDVITFTGGIKRKMKELGLSYTGAKPHLKGIKDNYKGWIIRCL